ncbi:MAG: hypothetical protein ABW019_09340 [Chitinophagaceae bacterium]
MGYGAYMRVVNSSSKTVTTNVTNQNCMYDNGSEGSNLSLFNNLTITPGTKVPAEGGQYIEAKNSGSCFFESSTFTLAISNLNSSVDNLNFVDSSGSWSCSGQPSNVNVNINNDSGDQGSIVITLYDPS